MTPSCVIKLVRDDQDSACVLVQVTQTGPKALDVKLEASEGEAPYSAASSLRVNNCPVSESEWETILESIFSQKPVPHIQATASIQGESSMSITVRKEVQGITQRLGSISLKCDPSEALDIFQWCVSSQNSLERSNEALAQSIAHAEELEVAVKELKSQLDELITTKQDDETALLQKFRDLLNEKKVKIREQQKIIAAAPLQNSQQHASPQSQTVVPPPQPARKVSRSRPSKRKAPATRSREDSDEDDSGEMEVDKIKSEPEDSDAGRVTDATASGGSDDESEAEDLLARMPLRPEAESSTEKDIPSNKAPSTKAVGAPPPPRSLPFARKKAPELKPKSEPAGSETDSDDEL
ncbi:hypothetical protein PT974_02468 [Cladobotryum mycophilum]|uniref:Mitotic apparatus protein p62 n=1 Tax=Cladobotryum mycophilum TaxID=491253 RepID=A0ABR0SZG1_9HYPO